MPDRACPAKGRFQGCVQAVTQQVRNTEQTNQESRFWEGDEDGGKLCVYGEQTPGRSGGRKGAGWKKREGVKEESGGQARSAIY